MPGLCLEQMWWIGLKRFIICSDLGGTMIRKPIRWLIDNKLPNISDSYPDTVHYSDFFGDIVEEAIRSDRTIITTNQQLLRSQTIPSNSPPIVIINGIHLTPETLVRNLRHFEFCLLHNEALHRQKFLIDTDRGIYELGPDGILYEIETWKNPNIKTAILPDARSLVGASGRIVPARALP